VSIGICAFATSVLLKKLRGRSGGRKVRQLTLIGPEGVEPASSLGVSSPELRVRINVNSRQRNFKPDPVCAFHSVRKEFAIECGYVVGRYMIIFVNCLIDTRKRCLLAGSKVFHGRRLSGESENYVKRTVSVFLFDIADANCGKLADWHPYVCSGRGDKFLFPPENQKEKHRGNIRKTQS
jgi:hypothetical protein